MSTLEHAWSRYLKCVVEPSGPHDAKTTNFIKHTFYAGAKEAMDEVATILRSNPNDKKSGVRALNALDSEIHARLDTCCEVAEKLDRELVS